MTTSTAKFLVLHLMFAILMFGCLALAGDGVHVIGYLLAGVLVWPVIGTLKDFIRYYRADLDRKG